MQYLAHPHRASLGNINVSKRPFLDRGSSFDHKGCSYPGIVHTELNQMDHKLLMIVRISNPITILSSTNFKLILQTSRIRQLDSQEKSICIWNTVYIVWIPIHIQSDVEKPRLNDCYPKKKCSRSPFTKGKS